ncbi:ARM repeat-containing protein [Panus rudis PR-1116 ss-1]|nr:ARM repeat-containing protein [Panus rudis PR-1116 ss-1]
MPARVANSLENLPANVARIFDQAQNTSANHQKNFVALYKLQTDAAAQDGSNAPNLTGERVFQDTFMNMLGLVFPVKRGNSVADRIMRFVGGYVKFMNEKTIEEAKKKPPPGPDDDDDTVASRFVSRVLRFLFQGSLSKDKVVRFRVLQCIAEIIPYLGEIDEDLFNKLRETLVERVRDKEVPVRVQSVVALSKICGADDEDASPSIIEILMDTMCYDASADVRRAALVHMPVGPLTLPSILSRMRDVDPSVRKAVYATVLNPLSSGSDGEISPAHPRAFKIAQRETIVRNGLGDREESVKQAAEKLLANWIDVVQMDDVIQKMDSVKLEANPHPSDEETNEPVIIRFLKLFDLINESKVPEDALMSVFQSRVDILDSLEFSDNFWNDLTPEKAFLARVFASHCINTKDNVRLETSLPVVTLLAFKIQEHYNNLNAFANDQEMENFLKDGMVDGEAGEEEEERRAKMEEERIEREFVIGEMLKLAVNLDYADEIGRRKMFQLVRDMISEEDLPDSLVSLCLDVLRKLSPYERDLIRVVVEVIHELRDQTDEEEPIKDDGETTFGETPATIKTVRPAAKPVAERTPEEQARADAMDLRCLSLCIGMLERVNGTFEENSTLEGILGELIIPAVKRKELALREKGLVSLGLCCLIARRMALNSFQLFLSQVQSAPEILKLRVLQIIFDILMIHEGHFLGPGNPNGDRIIEFLLHVLENEESDSVQALLCVGISKLMLSGFISDERVLRSLVLVFMSPETAENQELRQCLSYFFPVYCYSSAANQQRMQKLFIPVFQQLCEVYKEWDGEEDMITPAQAGLVFVDWTDPQKAAAVAKDVPGRTIDETLHMDMAHDIIKALFSDDMIKDDKKALALLLGKLYIPESMDDDKVRTLKLLMQNLRARRPLRDTASKNAFNKFEAAFTKKFEKQLEDFNKEEYRKLEHLHELFQFLDDIIPEDDEEEEVPKKRTARKRRSESVATDATSQASDDDRSTPLSVASSVASKTRAKGKTKRRRVSTSDDEEDDDAATERGNSPPTVKPPTRVLPKRSAATKSRAAVSKAVKQVGSSSEEDEEEDDVQEEEDGGTPTPPSRRSKPASRSSKPPSKAASTSKQSSGRRSSAKAREDAQLEDVMEDEDTQPGHDSIMDTTIEEEDDEDDDEVDNLL